MGATPEANYVVTPFICEFFNTISSLAKVLAGVLGALRHRRVFDRWMLLAFGLLGVVGLGSIAFHATLKFEFQMLDELPMLYLVALMVYLLLEPGPTRRFGRWLPSSLLAYAVAATCSDTLTRGRIQFFAFQVSFGALEFFCLYRIYLLSREVENRAMRPLFGVGVTFYVGAILLWFIDIRYCSAVSVSLPALGIANPQLHAWWHVLVSCGFYVLLLIVGYDRLHRSGARPETKRLWRLLPSVSIGERPPQNAATSSLPNFER